VQAGTTPNQRVYILSVPTLIAGYIGDAKLESTLLAIDQKGTLPLGYSGVVVSTVQTGTFTPTVAWSGDTLPTTATGITEMIQKLQTAYNTSAYSGASQISALISTTGSTALLNYGNGLLSNALGGNAVTLATNTNTTTTITCSTGYILVP